ncbi:MAG TPA: type I DNA topoisomerase, partial [Acidobacteriaceae bacterium]
VESPNKIRKIKAILDSLGDTPEGSPGDSPGASLRKTRSARPHPGGGWEVAASVGHIRDLPLKELGLSSPDYLPQYELTERGRDVVRRLKPLASRADQVYLATDPDREGEAISWHLQQALALRSYQRVAFDAITPAVIARALERPRRIDTHLVQAQEARRVLDRLVGYQVSPVLSRQTARRGLSAGRVQSPAVRLVVDREREIDAFRETKHFGAEVSFDSNQWRAQWDTAPFLPAREKYLLDQALAERAALCRDFRVEASENKHATQPPPPPFTTSTLLQAASVTLRLKPDVTAQLAQRLFDAGLITYHRTDSQNFSTEALSEVREFAAGRGLPLPASARHWKSRAGAQEAHECIRPTHFATEAAGDDRLQQALYRLIWTRAVASQLADAEYSVNTLRLLAEGDRGLGPEGRRFVFRASGRTLLAPGWKALTARDETEEDEPAGDSCGKVPLLPVGATPRAETGRVLHKKTQPPPRYTQASLIKKLESIGIGRPSTYPAILKNVLTRGYLEEQSRLLAPTPLGSLVVDTLVPRFRFLDYAFTRDLEQQLDDIAEGKAQYREVVARADAQLQQELAALGATPLARPAPPQARPAAPQARPAPPQARPAARRSPASGLAPGRSPGKRTRLQSSPGLSTAAPARAARPGLKKASADPTRKAASPARPSRTRKPADATPGEPPPSAPPAELPCPRCKHGSLHLSRDEKFYGCSQFREGHCAFTLSRTVAGRPLQPAELAALCTTGRTAKLSGFTSKAGRPFEAVLVLNEAGKVEFSFTPR